MDFYRFDARIEKLLERVEKLNGDGGRIKGFHGELKAQGLSPARQHKLLQCLTVMSERMQDRGKSLAGSSEKDLLYLVEWIEDGKRGWWTKRDYKVSLKRFLEYCGKESLAVRIRPSVNGRKQKRKLPENLLTEEEIQRLIDAARNSRDKALFALLADAGLRIGEALFLRVKDVVFDDYGAYIMVPDGKTGGRRVRLVSCIQHLRNWLEVHPSSKRDSKLFVRLDKNGNRQLMYTSVRSALQNALKRSGIDKRVHPHLFRHTAATRAAKFMTEQEMKVHFGWEADSIMPAIYVHLSGRDVEDKILSHYGIKEDGQEEMIACPKCGKRSQKSARFCYHCSCILDREFLQEADGIDAKMVLIKRKLFSEKGFEKMLASILDGL
jgi:integrase